MKIKILLLSLLTPLLLVPIAYPALAQTPRERVCEQISHIDPACRTGQDRLFGPAGLVNNVVNILTFIIGAAAVIVIIIGGLMYVLSGGNPESTRRAKDAILYAVIGLVVAIAARAIVAFILGRI